MQRTGDPAAVLEQSVTITHTTSGPLPTPRDLAGYETIYPGAAERIFDLAESEQTHRHRMEASDKREITRSQWMAWSLVMAFLACGTALLFMGLEPWGLTLLMTMGGGATVLSVWKRRNEQRAMMDEEKKRLEEQLQRTQKELKEARQPSLPHVGDDKG